MQNSLISVLSTSKNLLLTKNIGKLQVELFKDVSHKGTFAKQYCISSIQL